MFLVQMEGRMAKSDKPHDGFKDDPLIRERLLLATGTLMVTHRLQKDQIRNLCATFPKELIPAVETVDSRYGACAR